LPAAWDDEIATVIRSELEERAQDPDGMNPGLAFMWIHELATRITGHAHDHGRPGIRLRRWEDPERRARDSLARFYTVGMGDEVADPDLDAILTAIATLDPTDTKRRSLRLDVRIEGRRRTMFATFEDGALRVAAWGTARKAFAVHIDGRSITLADLPVLFVSFYDAGEWSAAYTWNPT
jgi:hypothetical protein